MSSPTALLQFADDLKLQNGAHGRAAISRAYYGAFHALQDAIDPMTGSSDRGRNGCAYHAHVGKCLTRWSQVHPDKKLGMKHGADALKCYHHFRTLLEARELADYQLGEAGEHTALAQVQLVGKARRVAAYAQSFLK